MRSLQDYLTLRSWRWVHFRPAINARGKWLTAQSGHKGFPDVCAVRGNRLVFIEAKREGGYPTPEQREWIADLNEAGAEAYVWRPRDWPEIERVMA